MRSAAARRRAACLLPAAATLWRDPHPSKRSSVVPAPCAARCAARVAAESQLQPRRLVPCIAPLACPPVRRACRYGSARWPSLPQSSLYSPLKPAKDAALPRVALRGSARLACARPAFVGRSLRHAPCIHGLLLASLRARSATEDVGCSLPCRSASNRPAHAPRGRAAKPIASTSCIDPTHRQGIAPSLLGLLAALASNPLGCLKASGGRRIARTGPSLVVPPATGPPVPRESRGRNTMRSPGEVGAPVHRSAHRAK